MSALAVPTSSALIWKVLSDDPKKEPYTVELDSFAGNGECTCPHFQFSMRPRLVRGETVADAEQEPEWMGADDARDALRCKHILEARRAMVDSQIAAFDQAKRAHRATTSH